LLQTYNDER